MKNVFKEEFASKFHDALVKRCVSKIEAASLGVQYPDGVDKSSLIWSYFNVICCGVLKSEEHNEELAFYYHGINDAMCNTPRLPGEEMDKISSFMLKNCADEVRIWACVITIYEEYGIVNKEDLLHVARDLNIDMEAD